MQTRTVTNGTTHQATPDSTRRLPACIVLQETATYRGVEAHFSLVKGVVEPNVSRHRSSDTRFQQTEGRSARENLGVSGGASFVAVMHESGIVPASLCSARTHLSRFLLRLLIHSPQVTPPPARLNTINPVAGRQETLHRKRATPYLHWLGHVGRGSQRSSRH
jgi:hypothetical protein